MFNICTSLQYGWISSGMAACIEEKHEWSWLDRVTEMITLLLAMMGNRCWQCPASPRVMNLVELPTTLGKWLAIDFQTLQCVEGSLPVKKNQSVGHRRLKWRTNIFMFSKRKKKIKHANCENLLYWKKIVCILNGVCCAIVHLHCINVKKKAIVAEKLNVWTKSAKMWHAYGVCFFLSQLRHPGVAYTEPGFWCWTWKAILKEQCAGFSGI